MKIIDEVALKGVLMSLGIGEECISSALPLLLGGPLPQSSQVLGLLNMKRTREYLGGVSRWTVMRAVEAGILRCTRIGRRVMFAEEDLRQYVRGLRNGRV